VSGVEVAYWRSTSGFEVDFVLKDQTAVETKAKKNVSYQPDFWARSFLFFRPSKILTARAARCAPVSRRQNSPRPRFLKSPRGRRSTTSSVNMSLTGLEQGIERTYRSFFL